MNIANPPSAITAEKKPYTRQPNPQQSQEMLHKRQGQPPYQKKKLRESCDSCATSKVKCSRDQPICARCEDRGIRCEYSPSRRTGKRRRIRTSDQYAGARTKADERNAPFTIHTKVKPKIAVNDPRTRDIQRHHHQNAPWNSNIGCKYSTPGTEASMLRLPGKSFVPWGGSDFHAGIAGFRADVQPGFYDPACHDMEFAPHGHKTMLGPPALDTSFSVLHQDDSRISSSSTTPTLTPDSTRRNSSVASYDIDLPPVAHDCMTVAVGILQALHVAPGSCDVLANQRGKHLQKAIPTIDHALATNKETIDSLERVIECSCSLNPELYLILTLVASKLIAWYGAVARCDHQLNTGLLDNNMPNMAPERVRYLPITLGMYHLAGESEEKMRAQLVLRELNRAVGLVGRLAQRFCHSNSLDGFGDMSKDGARDAQSATRTMGAELEAFLLFRMRSITTQAMKVLQAA
ncbi:hypothetical protein B0J14DRAFT_65395 [Halenospora varia]|nr:hypothetical protein B0J14DRAFT_65395 [Halenospora varia]